MISGPDDTFDLRPALQGWHRLQDNYKSPHNAHYSRDGWAHFQEESNIQNIPLTEGGSVNDNDGILNKGLGPDI